MKWLFLMSVNHDLLEKLMNFIPENSPEFLLNLDGSKYPVTSISIVNSPTPVNEPTTRGGVYFSDKFAYKMKGVIEDLSIVPQLTKKMLGPNTEFGELKISTKIEEEGEPLNLEITTNLTNSVQTPNSIELSMIIVNLKSD